MWKLNLFIKTQKKLRQQEEILKVFLTMCPNLGEMRIDEFPMDEPGSLEKFSDYI